MSVASTAVTSVERRFGKVDSTSTPRPCIAIELNDRFAADSAGSDRVSAYFQKGLDGLNLDYKAALTEFPEAMTPIVQTHAHGEGPFKEDAGRIKQRRIVR
jgi:hypothetical protein